MQNALKSYLEVFPTGEVPVERVNEIESMLFKCWHELSGGEEHKMQGFKILHRTENMRWEPPILGFDLERHGRQAGGSTRADLHTWNINLATNEALIVNNRLRYVGGMDKALKVEPLAEELSRLILDRTCDKRVRWLNETRVKIAIRGFIPRTNWRATKGREERFRKAVSKIVGPHGWRWNEQPYHRNCLDNESV